MTYRNKLYIAMKYMKNEDEAMDVLHDSYVKAFERLSGLQDANSFPGCSVPSLQIPQGMH